MANGKNAEAGSAARKQAVFIVWRSEYDLGIPLIDEQHRSIVATINTLHDAMTNRRGEDALSPAVAMVNEYTRVHFAAEEGFHRKHAYPEAPGHRELHRGIVDALAKVGWGSQWKREPREFLNFLKNWFIDHICRQDRAFRDYLVQRNANSAGS